MAPTVAVMLIPALVNAREALLLGNAAVKLTDYLHHVGIESRLLRDRCERAYYRLSHVALDRRRGNKSGKIHFAVNAVFDV